jgi:fluoride exporter
VPVSGFVAVGVGAAAGAWMRWALGLWLNSMFPIVPLGTLTANLTGGLIIGGFVGACDALGFPPLVRLLVVTGFLGGLTTFSTFSAETSTLLLQARFGWASVAIAAHVLGSLCLTVLGIALMRSWLGD